MPQAAEQHSEHQVAVGEPAPAAATAEGNVQVVAQPTGERNVPAPPKIRHAGRQVGALEVDGEVEPEQFGHADGHIGVAGEIEIDL